MGNWWLISYLTFLNSGGFLKSRKSHLQGFHQKNKWDQIPTDSWGTRAIRYSGWTLFPFSGSECWWFLGMILLMRTPKYPTLINPPPLPLAYSHLILESHQESTKRQKKLRKKKESPGFFVFTWIFHDSLDSFGDFESIGWFIFVENLWFFIRSRDSYLEASLKEVAVVHRTRMEWTCNFGDFLTDFRKTSKSPSF